ncbi:adenylate/guanylate cyclase domain-containing protein [Terrarubrum flagellatum]|uniref:CHASE2 domain-containing protein n=1 Tax=Terrirubrum flagellatum TaxID=2895980 RepID=UPI00314560CD
MSQNPVVSSVRRRTRSSLWNWAAAIVWALPPAVLCAALILAEPTPVRAIKNLIFDSFVTWKPRAYDPQTPVRVVDIDEESLARIGQWPWPRTTLARLVKTLGDAGAAVVALDILLSEPDRTSLEQVLATMPPSPVRDELEKSWREKGVSNDAALADIVGQTPVVIGLVATSEGGAAPPMKYGLAWAGDPAIDFLRPPFSGSTLPLTPLVEAAAGVGALNFLPDRDTIVRRAPTFVRIGDKIVPSLSMEALRIAQQASTYVIKSSNANSAEAFGAHTGIVSARNGDAIIDTESDGSIRIYYSGYQAARRIPAWKVLTSEFNPEDARNRIVFVGASAAALSDVRATPIDAIAPGVEVHAEAVEHIVSGAHLVRPDYARGAEAVAIIAAGLLAAIISIAFSATVGAALAMLLAIALALGSWFLFSHNGLLFDAVFPPLSALASFASVTIASYRRSEQDKAQIRSAFGRYVSPAVIERLIADPSQLQLGGEMRDLTVMFSDIRNFTSRSERLPATEVVRFLNAVHTPMSDIVMRSGGTLDKYIGDGMMAFWNAPLDDPDHVRNALRAALAMIEALPSIAGSLPADESQPPQPPLGLGVGLHTGPACVGNLGSTHRFNYSIVGDTVNSAARIEPLCKDYGTPVIVSEAIVEAAPEFAYLEIDEVALRGRQGLTRIFALQGDAKRAASEEFQALKRQHDEALAAVRSNATDALARIAECETSPAARPLLKVYGKWRARSGASVVSDA